MNRAPKPLLPWPARIIMFGFGAWILHHEVAVAETSELWLVLAALWLMGAPIAQFLDVIRGAEVPPDREPPSARDGSDRTEDR